MFLQLLRKLATVVDMLRCLSMIPVRKSTVMAKKQENGRGWKFDCPCLPQLFVYLGFL